ncbi:heme A synthase [Evansella vedderi]|uniref:Heme A synthase n=1 Tax=Evansella vedderi TaxID=38282 RepID=A0ABT9ZYV2_9BACI|nr:heme A synthase [Evansella vedderi]
MSESANNLRWMAYTQRLGSGLLILMVAILSVWSWKALRKQLIWRGTINV